MKKLIKDELFIGNLLLILTFFLAPIIILSCTNKPLLAPTSHWNTEWKHQSDQYDNFLQDNIECNWSALTYPTRRNNPIKPLRLGTDENKPERNKISSYDECMVTKGYYK